MLGKVFAVEARCKADKLSPQQRLEVRVFSASTREWT
jgi:hypothetical protein